MPVATGHEINAGRVALLLPSLTGGGAERMLINLATALADRGYSVDLVISRASGRYFSDLPQSVRLVTLRPVGDDVRKAIPPGVNVLEYRSPSALGSLGSLIRVPEHWRQLLPLIITPRGSRVLRAIPALARYLRAERPRVLMSALFPANVMAVVARELVGSSTRIVVSERNDRVEAAKHETTPMARRAPALVRHFYPLADAVLAVSEGVADALSSVAGLPRERITVVKNPVVTPLLKIRAKETVEHAWLEDNDVPLVLSVASLTLQKDLPTLIRAMAKVRQKRPVRLLILGEGPEREHLITLTEKLNMCEHVEFYGFAGNPYAFMARANLLALSSAWEGLANVLVEAMACGCPVVSTDCPSGPSEILEGGNYGALVPVGDVDALADAIDCALDSPRDGERLRAWVEQYSAAASADQHARLLGPDRDAHPQIRDLTADEPRRAALEAPGSR